MASEYKHMAEFIKDDQALLARLADSHCKVQGSRIVVIAGAYAFQVLADLAERGYRLFNPGLLAKAWGISRQAVNNAINRGLLVTIEYDGGFSFEYKYVLFESPAAQAERVKRRALVGAESYFGGRSSAEPAVEEPVRDAAGWVQEAISFPPVAGFEGLTQAQIDERNSICGPNKPMLPGEPWPEGAVAEWVTCPFRSTCFDPVINKECICQKEDGPLPVPSHMLSQEINQEDGRAGWEVKRDQIKAAISAKIEAEPITSAELYQEFPDERPTVEELRKKNFKEGEIKILRAGFALVLYDREQKTVYRSYPDPRRGWAPMGIFPTYAAAERKVAELLEDPRAVQVNFSGQTLNSRDEKKLRDAGFSFYRNAGMDYGEKWGRIKIGPSWSTYRKLETREDLETAWTELMKDEKALQG